MPLARRTRRPPRRPGTLPTLVCALVLGVLGMHALATSCGTMPSDASAAGSVGTSAVEHAQHASDGDEDGSGAMSPVLMSVCAGLVVTALVLLAALAAVGSRRGRPMRRWATALRRSVLPAPPRRPPPSPARLGLLRC